MAGTGNYLYTIAAHTEPATALHPNAEGVGAVTSYDSANTQMVASQVMTIDAPGTPQDTSNTGTGGNTQDPALTDRSIFYRVSNNNTNAYNNPSKPYFSVLIGNRDVSSVGTWDGILGMNNEESNWLGSTPSLTWHTPFLGIEVYTLIVPTDNLIYESGTGRLGCALVWHIPYGELGVYGQNANLPFRIPELPTASDTDIKAAAKIWFMGFGLIADGGTSLPYLAP